MWKEIGAAKEVIFNNTWGHLAPKKNISYKGEVIFLITGSHSEYGCQPILIKYKFNNLYGPYIHSKLFEDCLDWTDEYNTRFIEGLEEDVIYKMKLTFRNYRFYYSKPQILTKI